MSNLHSSQAMTSDSSDRKSGGDLRGFPKSGKFRNTVISIFCALLLLVGLHWCWRHYEYTRFMGAVRNLQAAGEPVLPTDVKEPEDEARNPVPKWRQAAKDLDPQTEDLQREFSLVDLEFPLTKAEADQLRRIVAVNGKSLADAAAAAQLTGQPLWHIRVTSPIINVLLPDLNEQRKVARLLYAAALDARQRGDDRESLAYVEQILRQQRAVDHQFGIISHLVAIGIGAMADQALRQLGPSLRIGDGPAVASRQQVQNLIAGLLDDTDQRRGQRRAFQDERMLQADSVLAAENGTLNLWTISGSRNPATSSHLSAYFLSPTLYGDGVIMLYHTTKVMAAGQAPDWPSCAKQLQTLHLDKYKGDPRHYLLSALTPSFERALQQDFRLMTENRLSAVLLACRVYAHDHDERCPESLNALVPTDLPAVPEDLMASARPLQYRPGPDPIVYSVGEDGIDDGGSEKPTSPGAGRYLWMMKDAVVHLTPQPRQLPPQVQENDALSSAPATAPSTHPADSGTQTAPSGG